MAPKQWVLIAWSLSFAWPSFAQDWSWLERGRQLELPEELYMPIELDFDSKGNMYLGDYKASGIFKISPDGEILFAFGRKGRGPGELEYIADIAVDRRKDLIWAVDYAGGFLSCFDTEGTFIKRFPINGPPRSLSIRNDGLMALYYNSAQGCVSLWNDQGEVVKRGGYRPGDDFEESVLFVNQMMHMGGDGRVFTATYRARFITAYDAALRQMWQIERPWTLPDVKEEPLVFTDDYGWTSTTYHLSLFVHDDVLYVTTDEEEQAILAFNAQNGAFLGHRKLGFRARNANVYQDQIYMIDPYEGQIYVYALSGEAKSFTEIRVADGFKMRYELREGD